MSGPVSSTVPPLATGLGAESARMMLLPAGDAGVEVVARFLRALADPARLRLLEFLLDTEHTVTECVSLVGLSQGRVSVHLACLAECGYVQARRQGRNVFYQVADPRVADLVVLAHSMAVDNAAVLAACMHQATAGTVREAAARS
jgi:ArsR family transcriptional regulator, cadmium/lead-responsive transcriptional repressor